MRHYFSSSPLRMGSINIIMIFGMVLGNIGTVIAEEPLDFVAEHLLEVPMDMRYQSLPKVPIDRDSSSTWLQIGGGEVSGGKIANQFSMLAVNFYQVSDSTSGWLFSLFYDNYQFSGQTGITAFSPSFGAPAGLPSKFQVDVNNTSGNGFHIGGSAAYSIDLSSWGKLQLGIILEQLKTNRFVVNFNTVGLTDNFNGLVDYASTYNIHTQYLIYQFNEQRWSNDWQGAGSLIIAKPSPRSGFKGRFQGPDFVFDSDTNAVGLGKHIPDNFIGFSYFLEHRPSGISINIGGTLFSYFLEPKIHQSIDRPIYLTVNKTF